MGSEAGARGLDIVRGKVAICMSVSGPCILRHWYPLEASCSYIQCTRANWCPLKTLEDEMHTDPYLHLWINVLVIFGSAKN